MVNHIRIMNVYVVRNASIFGTPCMNLNWIRGNGCKDFVDTLHEYLNRYVIMRALIFGTPLRIRKRSNIFWTLFLRIGE